MLELTHAPVQYNMLMTDESPAVTIERTLACEWWVARAAFLTHAERTPAFTRYSDQFTSNGCLIIIMAESKPELAHLGTTTGGSLTLTTNGDNSAETRLVVEVIPGYTKEDYAALWRMAVRSLERFVSRLHEGRRRHAPNAEDVIEMYYRSKAAGGKVTLKQLAEKYGFNRTYLSQVKKEYDLAGKWGSKGLGNT